MDIISYTSVAKIDFESLTLETLDFDNPFKMEYCYRIWKTHPLEGEELRRVFWKYMSLHCEKHWNERDNLAHYLFMWYAPELLKALTNKDLYTQVVYDENDEKFHDEVIIDGEIVWKPFHGYVGGFTLITVYCMLESFSWNTEGGSGPLNGLYAEECYEMGYWNRDCLYNAMDASALQDLRDSQYILGPTVDEAIQNDDLDSFRRWHFTNEATGVGFESHVSIYYPIDLFHHLPPDIGLLDVAFYFKATKIINFLLLNGYKAKTTRNSLVIAVAIGAPELVRLSLQYMEDVSTETPIEVLKTRHGLMDRLMEVAKLYDRTEILSWLEDITDGKIDSI
jgi:hypothetical protein